MNVAKLITTCLVLSLLSACGMGKFFIKRAVNGVESDVAKEFKSYADFDQNQKQQIDDIARQVDAWVRTDRLKIVYRELEKIAGDIEQNSQISELTWSSTIALIERPMNLATQTEVVEGIAKVVHSMSDQQAEQAITKLEKEYSKALKKKDKQTLEKQNKNLAKGFKLVFSELGVSRSKAQMAQAKIMLAQRKSHIELDKQAALQDRNAILELARSRQTNVDDYINRFRQAWISAERGAKHRAPELWNHNAEIAFEVLNYLLSDLNEDQRQTAASNIRSYADLFRELSVTKK